MNLETNELMEYLHRIARKSGAGDIPWSQPNPSTFVWLQRTGDETFQVTIQKASTPTGLRRLSSLNESRESTTYLFQVQDRMQKSTSISLSSKERPEIFDALEDIYRSAEKGMDVRAANVLRKLLDN